MAEEPSNELTVGAKVEHYPKLTGEVFDSRLAFSVKETAQILGVCEKTVRRLISRNLIRASKALRHLIIPKKEIIRFLDETLSQ